MAFSFCRIFSEGASAALGINEGDGLLAEGLLLPVGDRRLLELWSSKLERFLFLGDDVVKAWLGSSSLESSSELMSEVCCN